MNSVPHSEEAESAVLSAMIYNNGRCDEARSKLTADDFYLRQHQLIFRAIAELADRGMAADVVTIIDALREMPGVGSFNPADITKVVEFLPIAANLNSHITVVKRHSLARKLVRYGQQVATNAADEEPADVIEAASRELHALADSGRDGRRVFVGREIAREAMKEIEAARASKGAPTGVETGFARLDAALGGMHKQHLLVLAARPAMGKTTLAMSIANHAALRRQKAVVFFQLEMSVAELGKKTFSAVGGIDATRVRQGMLSENDMVGLLNVEARLSKSSLVVDDSAETSLVDIRLLCRKLKASGPLDLVIVDYLQKMRSVRDRDNREREVAEFASGLKAIAKEFDVPVLALAQLNRGVETRTEKRPTMGDLRESGAIEQDADVIMFLYRDEVYNKNTQDKGVAEIILAKNRHGEIGEMRIAFDAPRQRFEDAR